MARVLLGVTGSVAAIRTPALAEALWALHHDVRIVATEASLYFFEPGDLPWGDPSVAPGRLFRDRDEWPHDRYQRGDPVLHIELRNWAELLVVAPLDANTLGKFALGLSDNFLTCVFRAWDFQRPVLLAPAMNTLMWQSPVTSRHLGQILLDHGRLQDLPPDWSLESAPDHFARLAPRIVLIPPQAKRLACGDIGLGAMAEVEAIAQVVHTWTSSSDEEEHKEQARVTKP